MLPDDFAVLFHGQTLVVQSDTVAQAVAVRYAGVEDALANLTNREGPPASPFRPDKWK